MVDGMCIWLSRNTMNLLNLSSLHSRMTIFRKDLALPARWYICFILKDKPLYAENIYGVCELTINNQVLDISTIDVDPAYRNNGIGKCMIGHIVDYAKLHNYSITITHFTDMGNKYIKEYLKKLCITFKIPISGALLTPDIY